MPYQVGDSYEVFERPAIDSRLIDKISRDPRVVIEQTGKLSSWGGLGGYKRLVRLPVDERLVYLALQAGIQEPADIAVALQDTLAISRSSRSKGGDGVVDPSSVITSIITKLQKKGLVRLK